MNFIKFYGNLAQIRYSEFPCTDHSNESHKTEIVLARGLHDFLSFISIAQKETLHIGFVPNSETKRYFYKTFASIFKDYPFADVVVNDDIYLLYRLGERRTRQSEQLRVWGRR